MTTLDLIIEDPVGLHARPVSVLVNAIKEYEAEISMHHNEKKANAKSMLSVLQLGAHCGAQVTMTIDGPESEAAFEALQALFANELKQEFSVMGSK
jgi:phosphotransferase system HPr (HPr) family protein